MIPTWNKGPGRKVAFRVKVRTYSGGEVIHYRVAAEHIQSIWNICRVAGQDGFVFLARIGRHMEDCSVCKWPQAQELWRVAIPSSGMADVLSAFRKEYGLN